MAKEEGRERGREGIDWLSEFQAKNKLNEGGREGGDRLVESMTESEMGEMTWQVVNWLIEVM